eukprot:5289319-Pleurochrysis_carterae.AAC.1
MAVPSSIEDSATQDGRTDGQTQEGQKARSRQVPRAVDGGSASGQTPRPPSMARSAHSRTSRHRETDRRGVGTSGLPAAAPSPIS